MRTRCVFEPVKFVAIPREAHISLRLPHSDDGAIGFEPREPFAMVTTKIVSRLDQQQASRDGVFDAAPSGLFGCCEMIIDAGRDGGEAVGTDRLRGTGCTHCRAYCCCRHDGG